MIAFAVGLWLVLGEKKKDDICGMPLVRVKAKIENYILFGWPLVRVEKTPFVAGLWLLLGQK